MDVTWLEARYGILARIFFFHFEPCPVPSCERPFPLSGFLPMSGAYAADGPNNAMTLIASRLTMIFLLLLTLFPPSNVTASPPSAAIPLAVRSPYLNCWLPVSNNISTLDQTWPTTFNLTQVCHLHIFTCL
jgi:hypothetical protein